MQKLFFVCLMFISSSTAGCISFDDEWSEGPDLLWIELIYTQETVNPVEKTSGYMTLDTYDCWDKMRDGNEIFHHDPSRFSDTKVVIIEHHPQFSASHHDTIYWTFSSYEFDFQWNSSISNLTALFNGSNENVSVNGQSLNESNAMTYSELIEDSFIWRKNGDTFNEDVYHNITITNHGELKSFNKPKVDCD